MATVKLKHRIVIIGAGMAGCKLAQALIEERRADVHVSLIGEESEAGYNRIMLSPLLAQEISADQLAFVELNSLCQLGLNLMTGNPAVSVDYQNKTVWLESGTCIPFDSLVFATGARVRELPQIPLKKPNVIGFRNLSDVRSLASIHPGSKVCVVGGGLLGLEAAVGLAKRGLDVRLIHRSSYILNRQLDETAAKLLQGSLENLGIQFELGCSPIAVTTKEEQHANVSTTIRLDNNNHIHCDYVVLATGITPEVNLANVSGLKVNRAILVDEYLETSQPDVFAIGECTEFNNETFGLVAPIWNQLNVLVQQLLAKIEPSETKCTAFKLEASPTKLKVSGIHLYSVGDISKASNTNTIIYSDPTKSEYRKLIVENNVIIGAILYGNVAEGSWYFKLIQRQTNVAHLLNDLIFGEAYCTTESQETQAA